jgi:hypothetical protein
MHPGQVSIMGAYPQGLLPAQTLKQSKRNVLYASASLCLTGSVPVGQVIITGASSGLGLAAARALGQSGDWHVVMACRDFSKAASAAAAAGIPKANRTIMHLDLASFDSVRQFVDVRRRSCPLCSTTHQGSYLWWQKRKEEVYKLLFCI